MATKPVTLKDIARALNISSATVSIALNDGPSVNSETRRRVKEYAANVGYRPNVVARAMITGRSRLVAFVVASITDSFFHYILQGVENVAVRNGYDVLAYSTDHQMEDESSFVERLLDRRVDGLIGAAYAMSDDAIERLRSEDVHTALLRATPHPQLCTISVDNFEGGRLVGEHLAGLGHRKLLFIGTEGPYSLDRREGCSTVLSAMGGTVRHGVVAHGEDLEGARNCAAAHLSDGGFTAIFAADDVSAAGALQAVQESGRRVPEDISVVGYDDMPWSGLLNPSLTTVHQPQIEQGETAMRALIDLVEGRPAKSVCLSPKLITRRSSGPVSD